MKGYLLGKFEPLDVNGTAIIRFSAEKIGRSSFFGMIRADQRFLYGTTRTGRPWDLSSGLDTGRVWFIPKMSSREI